jgi:hypothetical protein
MGMRDEGERKPHGGIEYERAKIIEIGKTRGDPIQPKYRGVVAFKDGERTQFVTDQDDLAQGQWYHVVYEYTTTLTDETAIAIRTTINKDESDNGVIEKWTEKRGQNC